MEINNVNDNKISMLLDDIPINTIRDNLEPYLITPLPDINELRENLGKITWKKGENFYTDIDNILNFSSKYKKTLIITTSLAILFLASFGVSYSLFNNSDSNTTYADNSNSLSSNYESNYLNESSKDPLYNNKNESSIDSSEYNDEYSTEYNTEYNDKYNDEYSSNNYSTDKIINNYKYIDYIIPSSNYIRLSFSDLNEFNTQQLFIARNEIFARHGYIFKASNLRKYFESKDWFIADSSYTGNLSEIELNNVDMIKSVEFLKMAYESNSFIYDNFVFPYSDVKLLTSDEISSLNDWELVVAKNETFARYGLNFSINELKNHFNSKYWYHIDNTVGNDVTLNSIENSNIALLVQEEEKRILTSINHDLE